MIKDFHDHITVDGLVHGQLARYHLVQVTAKVL